MFGDPSNNCLAPVDPWCCKGQCAEVNTEVYAENCKVGINGQNRSLYCQDLVEWKLNEGYDPAFIATNLYANGCGVTTNSTTGRRETGCAFSGGLPRFNAACSDGDTIFQVKDCDFRWNCAVSQVDQVYKPVCCNATNIDSILDTGVPLPIDPYTGQPFDPRVACAPNWCLADPEGECIDLFNASCSTVSECNRHAFLSSNFPIQTQNYLVQSVTIAPSSKNGLQCFNWYFETKRQAQSRTDYNSSPSSQSVNDRVTSTVNIIKQFCANPETKGSGDCACINAYVQSNVQFAESLAPDALTFQYSSPNAAIPMMLVQAATGQFRRVDAFCSPSNQGEFNRAWIDPIIYTDTSNTTRVISNVCSVTDTFWFNSPLEYTVPSMNPNRNLNSLTNFGDVVVSDDVLESFRNLGQNLNVAMPLHCWHPACTSPFFNFLENSQAFLDLYAFTQTCPDVCYMYSGADVIDIGNELGSQTFIHINNTFQSCQFVDQNQQHAYQAFPFALPSGCQQLYIQVPTNFSDTIHLTVTNPENDISQQVQSKTLFAVSNLSPLVGFNSNSSISAIFGPEVLYKYSFSVYSGTPATTDSIVLSITVDTTGMSPFTSFQSEINLTDNSRNTQPIQVQVNVYPDAAGTGGSNTVQAFACGEVDFNPTTGLIECLLPCDCSFGANSTTSPCQNSFSLVDPLVAHTTGFSADGDPLIRPLLNLLAPQFGTNPLLSMGPSVVALAQALRFG